MSASRTRDNEQIPWWGYLGWIDDESLGWMYAFDALYGRETWPAEFDDSVKEGRSDQHRAPDLEGDAAPTASVGRGLFSRVMHALASRFRSEMSERRAPAANAERNLALPRSRI